MLVYKNINVKLEAIYVYLGLHLYHIRKHREEANLSKFVGFPTLQVCQLPIFSSIRVTVRFNLINLNKYFIRKNSLIRSLNYWNTYKFFTFYKK